MNKFTVVMLYPDYLQNSGLDTYVALVEAPDQKEACRLARLEAAKANDFDTGQPDPYDFEVLLVFEGHLEDIYEGH